MRLIITKTAEKSIKRLDRPTRKRIVEGIYKLPYGDIKKLTGHANTFRLRIGDFRVIYFSDGYTITIADVLPRGEAYKNL